MENESPDIDTCASERAQDLHEAINAIEALKAELARVRELATAANRDVIVLQSLLTEDAADNKKRK